MGPGQTPRPREFFVDFRPILNAQTRRPFIRHVSPFSLPSIFFLKLDPPARRRDIDLNF